MHSARTAGPILAMVLLSCAALSGKENKFSLEHGQRTPAAMGSVEIDPDKTGNNRVTLKVDHLPRPNDLQQSASTYVVWLEPKSDEVGGFAFGEARPDEEIGGYGAEAESDSTARSGFGNPIGAIKLNKDQQGELQFTTPYKSFTLRITPEASLTPEEPSDIVVLSGDVEVSQKPRR